LVVSGPIPDDGGLGLDLAYQPRRFASDRIGGKTASARVDSDWLFVWLEWPNIAAMVASLKPMSLANEAKLWRMTCGVMEKEAVLIIASDCQRHCGTGAKGVAARARSRSARPAQAGSPPDGAAEGFADPDRRCAQGHQQLDVRFADHIWN
jgi:hypothetical protein